MMIALPGFQIVTLLKAGVKAVIYRGIKVKDQCPVIIKGLRPEQCTPNNIEQLKHEYAIAQRLNIAAAVKVYALEMHQGIPYLIMEDFQARSLDQFLDQFQQPVPFLKIAIEITSKLAQIHTHHIVHKDIKPQNILINLETSQVKIADFGIAAFIPYQQQIVSSSSRIEGSLPYLSPEQTGRMNRGIDHRSDLYSLGITFYEMLTGQLPFQGKDPLEWVHCHIAKSPPSPKKLNSDIPQMLCDIIIKLLSKVAEQRYQSALGLQFDLERCLKQLEITGQIQSFVLGEQDISERFQIPQKLYGQEPEIAKILQAFERVVSQGKPELVLVSGYAGVGKSSLVKEIHKSIVRERGVFISGKFDQYKRDIPYSTIVQAFQTLARQILTQPENQLATWKKRIQAVLGNNGKLITDVIPEVELIVGEQPPIPELGPAESQNRFNLVFHNFISVFAQKEHPLTVFLDNMQWADSATLNFIQTVITGSSIQYLCFILAYQDNEVDVVPPFNLMIDKVLALKSAQIGVWSWDIANDRFDWDEQIYQLFGLTPETFAGTSEAILVRLHPDDRGLLAQSLSRAINEGVEHDLEYRIIQDDGSIRYAACQGKAFFNEAGKATHMSGVVLDITERKQSEAERIQLIQEQTARQEAEADQQRATFLAQVSTTLASSLDYERTLTSVANLAVPYFADWCAVDLLQDNQSINQVAVAHRDPEKVKLGWELHQRCSRGLDATEGVPKVVRTGVAEMVAEISDVALAAAIKDPEHLQILRELGLNSCIILPLMAHGRIFGAISFVTAESKRRYSTADLSLAKDVAHRAAIAIDNARLYQEAQQAQKTAERALERIARLQSITAALSESLTPAQVSDVIVEQSMAVLGASSALVALVNESKTELEIVRAVGYKQDLIDAWRIFAIDSLSPIAEAVRTGKPIWAESTENRVADYPHLAEIYAQYDFNAWISIPLMVEGWAVGGISLGFTQPQQLSGEDQAFILAVAQQCAQAIARAHLYEAERTARSAAESANRIKDEFLAVLSHELRTPLNPILGWAKLMQSRKLDQATSDRALETIERNAKLQTQLIEDLLDVSRILQGKLNLNFDRINLVSVMEAAIETVHLSAEAKSIQIQTTLESGVGQVLGDANRLQQVIWNILSNAIKFTPIGGQVKIKLEQVGSQVQICVTDTGKGIAPEFLPYVFDYFRQADGATTRKFGGLGLGLAIVRHLVELHGGTVQAESLGEAKGATFTVKLPYLQDENKGIKDAKDNSSLVAVQSSPLSGLEILVVDDDADMREFLPFMLEQYGATVTVVASAIEALTALSQSQPNLIISDIGMPEMDGYMLMRQIRSLEPEQGGIIPAIALTAYAGEMDHQQAIAVGFQQHISKPVDPEELVKAIASLTI
ncbi:AAA family ATPase [Nostoc sp.]|uniref:AAA family ATPase n=1 Tax=Nostoc sp. TaxID=1180 RepID=UPI002FF6D21B